jgi:hypothetical protein
MNSGALRLRRSLRTAVVLVERVSQVRVQVREGDHELGGGAPGMKRSSVPTAAVDALERVVPNRPLVQD